MPNLVEIRRGCQEGFSFNNFDLTLRRFEILLSNHFRVSLIHFFFLPLTRNTTIVYKKYIKDNIRTIFQLNYYKIKYGKARKPI